MRLYRRGRGWEADCGLLCAAGWAVFALFSYPGRYAHTWLLAGVAVWMLLRAAGMTGRGTAAGRFLRHGAVRAAGVILSLGLLAGTAVRADAEMRWRRAAHARQAARMCPGRLQPRKTLAEALMAAGRRDEACCTAREGLRMPVKVESAATELLRADLHRLLQEAGGEGEETN